MAASKQPRRKKCRTSGCTNEAQWRGVCRTCKRALDDLIGSGERTDAELVKIGAWAPIHVRGRKPIGPARIRRSLEKKLAKSTK